MEPRKASRPSAAFVLIILAAAGCESPVSHSNDDEGFSPQQTVQVAPQDSSRWGKMTPRELYDYVAQTDTTVLVGLKDSLAQRGVQNGVILLDAADVAPAVERVQTVEDVELRDVPKTKVPIVRLRVASPGAIARLRALPIVEYVEPANFVRGPSERFLYSSGCGTESEWTGPLDYFEGDVLPWNFAAMDVDDAWARSNGSGVRIGMVDTGVDVQQPEINGAFTSGSSGGRQIERDWTDASLIPPDWRDRCGHGTHAAGVMVAPKNGSNVVGVAWKADFVSVRHHDDAVNWFGVGETVEAISMIADDYQADIINMSFGTSSYSFSMAYEIQYWYNQGRLFVGAAGTTPCWLPDGRSVRFPAELSTVIAVTAIHPEGMPCEAAFGDGVELAAKASQPTIGNLFLEDAPIAKSGQSSNAAAVVSGIAALVWSEYPSWTNQQVRSRLCEAAPGHGDPEHSNIIGCGIVNAWGAVGGFWDVSVTSYGVVEPMGQAPYDFTATPHGGDGPYAYSWTVSPPSVPLQGASSQTVTAWVSDPLNFFTLYVTVEDLSDGTIVEESEFTQVIGCDPEVDPGCMA